MKRIFAVLLVVLTLCTLCACAAKTPDAPEADLNADATAPTVPEEDSPETPRPVENEDETSTDTETDAPETEEPEAQPVEPAQPTEITSALELLNGVWALYAEDDKFPAAGGDYSEENMTDGAPGRVGLDDADSVEYLLSFPAADVEKVSDAASLIHMMNTNTFTCGAFRLTDVEEMETVAADVKEYVLAKHWMCGFPDKLVIYSVGEYLVEIFGLQEQVDTFCENLSAAWPDAVMISEDPIA